MSQYIDRDPLISKSSITGPVTSKAPHGVTPALPGPKKLWPLWQRRAVARRDQQITQQVFLNNPSLLSLNPSTIMGAFEAAFKGLDSMILQVSNDSTVMAAFDNFVTVLTLK